MLATLALLALGATPAAPTSTIRPALSGSLQVGAQLAGDNGAWAGSGALAFAHQWYRCDATGAGCKAIRGATAATYSLTAADAGRTVGLTVRATDATGSANAYSGLAGPI